MINAKLTLIEWLKERRDNATRISLTSQDRLGWIEDAEYFNMAVTAIQARSFGVCARHCTICDGQDHHWMVDHDEESGDMVQRCKHCPARRLVGDIEETS